MSEEYESLLQYRKEVITQLEKRESKERKLLEQLAEMEQRINRNRGAKNAERDSSILVVGALYNRQLSSELEALKSKVVVQQAEVERARKRLIDIEEEIKEFELDHKESH